MRKAIRTTLSLVVSLVLFSAVALAHAGGYNADKDKGKDNKERHSRISKLAFWHHHKDGSNSAKTVQAKQAQPKQAQAKAALTKPAPATRTAGKRDQKQELHAKSQAPAKKPSTATKTKPQVKAKSRTTASLKQ
jgi:hypothetical protein